MSYNYLFKLIMVGDSGVGKSSLLLQFTNNTFIPVHDITIGVEFGTKNVFLDGKEIKLQVWDTAGQECFRSITRSYYRDSAGCVLVYDISRRDSFTHLKNWINDVKEMTNDTTNIILVGNKSDLLHKRAISYEEGKQFADDNNIQFIETSARDGTNIDETFINVAHMILKKIENKQININDKINGIKIGLNKTFDIHKNPEKGCCLLQ